MNMSAPNVAMDLTKRPLEHELDPIEIASRDEITAIQTRRLKWSVRHAYENVPHFRNKCDEKGIHPRDIKELSDLRHLPFTTKDDLRETYPYGMFAVPMSEVVRLHASSGTTGRPTVVGYTQQDIAMWSRVMARSIRAAGGRRNMKVHVSYGYGLFTGGLGAHYGAEALGCTVIPMSGGQTEKQVQLIRDFEPDVIMVTPSYMLVLADEMERQGMDPRDSSLKIGIFGAEPWTNDMRTELEGRLGLDAIDIYGLSEVIGPGVGIECIETKDGLTLWEDHFYPEIINPQTGEPVADGEIGELVFTSLTKEAMPVIRYRTRDLTRLLPGSARSMRRMEKITGRSDDMLIIRGVNVFPTQIEELILKDERLSPHYQLIVGRQGHLDTLKVRVEMRAGVDGSACDTAAKELQHHIKSFIGVSSVVDVEPHGAIERSQGKAKRVVDLRKEGG
ncbi:phenylacetate--CoA ligase PaaK [Caenispirillum salinarum]|uniref:phenylacetate--CoA ligase PaaK n=1 Tax=Caenispirillum salinarum TaxID=859058 RepID=UPI00384F5BA6